MVLGRLAAAGLKLKPTKCSFFVPVVEYLGHRIDRFGLHLTEEKVAAVRSAPSPTNFRAYLGLVYYYGKFIPQLATVLAPLYSLLQQGKRWSWGAEEKEAFMASKDALCSDKVLAHYDPSLELVLACDASPVGVGAVLSHCWRDGREQPIAYASQT
eukprot:m.119314 g.119314  ORF g.119314 m.119314 type:complete len:156 (+) comp37689_c0_seq1:424-891(+)